MKKRKKENIVTYHPDLTHAIKGFIPVFANEQDIQICLKLTKLHRKISSIDNESFRIMQKNKTVKGLTGKMKEIQLEERELLISITSRNLDF